MKTKLIAAIMALAAFASSASVTISDVIVRQQWPWNGKVNIDYVLSDPDGGEHDISVTLRNGPAVITNECGSLTGDLVGVKPGSHRIVWDPSFNTPTYQDAVMADFSATLTTLDDGNTYMVVDLSKGTSATAEDPYPVSFMSAPPASGWTDEYKTDKLVLRRIPAGTAVLGSPTDEIGRSASSVYLEVQRKTTFTNSFYMAVFETTQKQFKNVMGYSPQEAAIQDDRPLVFVPYQLLRGTNSFYTAAHRTGGTWPQHEATSFFGVLNSKLPADVLAAAGLGDYEMELPTASQWEYACRAGTTGSYNNGTTITNETSDANAYLLAQYGGNTYACPVVGGQKLANAYGLYDMHGNAQELTRDHIYYNYTSGQTAPIWDGTDQVEPLQYPDEKYWPAILSFGGGINNDGGTTGPKDVRSSSVIRVNPDTANRKNGFRIALTRKR